MRTVFLGGEKATDLLPPINGVVTRTCDLDAERPGVLQIDVTNVLKFPFDHVMCDEDWLSFSEFEQWRLSERRIS